MQKWFIGRTALLLLDLTMWIVHVVLQLVVSKDLAICSNRGTLRLL